MASTIIYLSDCTPLYTTLGAPSRIPVVSGFPLHLSARLEWAVPSNIENVSVDSYLVRYKLTGAPLSQTLNERLTFFPSIVITGLSNGISYDFWVVAKNRFGESPHSPTISVTPGSAPSACQIVRRAHHSTVVGNGIGIDGSNPQKVGLEFTPPLDQNGAAALIFTAKYTRLNGSGTATDISYTETYSIQTNETILDNSGAPAIVTRGIKGSYIRKEILPPTGAANPTFQSGNYRFQVFSSNIYGTSAAPDLSFVLYLYSNTYANTNQVARFTAPTFTSYIIPANGDISGIVPGDSTFRFTWQQYRGPGTGSTGTGGSAAYAGWSYRLQYSDDKDNWYYPPITLSAPDTAKFPEYTRAYDTTSVGSGSDNFEYSIDISRNIVNGRRYYIRYCVVNALGDTSEYTQITSTNLSLVSCIPGKLPNPPPIFRAANADRMIRLYFDWPTRPPSLELTGGLPILNYRIERYNVSRTNGSNPAIVPETITVFDNISGPYYEDRLGTRNGLEFEYRVYSRNAFGLSIGFISVSAIPSRPSDVVRNVTAPGIDIGQITLSWTSPNFIEPEMPVVQFYIEYKEYNLFNVSDIPAGNIVGAISNPTTITNTVQDLNSILVDDTLWAKLSTPVVGVFTNSLNLSYTIRDLINNKSFVFRIAAVTQDSARRKIIGLAKIIGSNNPYLQRPAIIGRVPSRLTNIDYTNLDSAVSITWTSSDINNTERIIRFIVDYDIATTSTVYSQRQTFDYLNSIVFNDGSTSVSYNIMVAGLNNNVAQLPDTRTSSYIMKIYAESSVGFTNEENKVKLQDLSLNEVFETLTVPRLVRPRTIPAIITELR